MADGYDVPTLMRRVQEIKPLVDEYISRRVAHTITFRDKRIVVLGIATDEVAWWRFKRVKAEYLRSADHREFDFQLEVLLEDLHIWHLFVDPADWP